MNVSLDHVAIGVHDVAAAIEFYELLGMTVSPNRPDFAVDGAWMQVGDRQLHLVANDAIPPGGHQHIAFRVEDLDASLRELDEHGVMYRRLAHTPGAGRQAFVPDPSGNVIELNQPD